MRRGRHDSPHLTGNGAIRVSHRFGKATGEENAVPTGRISIDQSWATPPAGAARAGGISFSGFLSEDDTWLVFPSSGTTGTPKFMAFSDAIMQARFAANAVEFPTGQERCVFLFAPHSPPTLMRALCALSCGASVSFSPDPGFWHDVEATHVFASPRQIDMALGDRQLDRRLGKALIGGDWMSDALAERLLRNFRTVVNTYGSTEANLVVENEKIRDENGRIRTRTRWHDSEVEIVDDEGNTLEAGQEGIVRIRNAYLAPGYLGNAQATALASATAGSTPAIRA